jgi:ribosomal protein S18 acetylase RimI-like enzyme
MMTALENEACRLGCAVAVMHAALPALSFYRRLGYQEMDFYEEGIDYSLHVDVGKKLG